jgi:hypothetical protein
MMEEVARLSGDVYVRPTQGSYSGGVSASAGTHDGGGAIDLAGQDAGMTQAHRDVIESAGRQVGLAMWIRTPDQSDWPWHLHGIAVQPGGKGDRGVLSSGAHGQVIDYFEGRNGLASGAADDGPRQWVGVTWETYQSSAPPPPKDEDDMPKARIFTLLGTDNSTGADDALGLFTPDGRFVPHYSAEEVALAERYVAFSNNPGDAALYGFEASSINSLLKRAV